MQEKEEEEVDKCKETAGERKGARRNETGLPREAFDQFQCQGALMCAEVVRQAKVWHGRIGRDNKGQFVRLTVCQCLAVVLIPVWTVLFRVGDDDQCCSTLMAAKFNLLEQSIAPKLLTLLGDDGK